MPAYAMLMARRRMKARPTSAMPMRANVAGSGILTTKLLGPEEGEWQNRSFGGVAERFKAPVLKTGKGASPS